MAQAQVRPARQSVFATASLSLSADGYNPRSGCWEPVVESWTVRGEGSMFDGVYGSSARGSGKPSPPPYRSKLCAEIENAKTAAESTAGMVPVSPN